MNPVLDLPSRIPHRTIRPIGLATCRVCSLDRTVLRRPHSGRPDRRGTLWITLLQFLSECVNRYGQMRPGEQVLAVTNLRQTEIKKLTCRFDCYEQSLLQIYVFLCEIFVQ